MAGDFIEILTHSEKLDGCTRLEKQLKDFQNTLEDFALRDLGHEGLRLCGIIVGREMI